MISSVFCGLVLTTLGLVAPSTQHQRSGSSRSIEPFEAPESLERCGLHHLNAGDPAAAEHCWRLAVERDPGRASTWVLLGRLALQRQEPAEAVDYLERALEVTPDSYPALHGLAAAHQLLGHFALARDYQAQAERAQRALPPATGGMGADAPPCTNSAPMP